MTDPEDVAGTRGVAGPQGLTGPRGVTGPEAATEPREATGPEDLTELDDLPYARPHWGEEEAKELLAALDSGIWTNGERGRAFEAELARLTGAPTVTSSSGTTAVHGLLHALAAEHAGPRLLVTPALTFAAAPAAALLQGWDIALADVTAGDLTLSPAHVAELLERNGGRYATTVVMPVHYAGHTADMSALDAVCSAHGALLVEDACHAIGAHYGDPARPVGSWPSARAAYFSFHPVKPLATGEGGAVASRDAELVERLRSFRNHHMTPMREHAHDLAPWPYTVPEPGANHRLSELHAALGLVQARRVEESRRERARLAHRYHRALAGLPGVRTVPARPRPGSAHHLFPVVFDLAHLGLGKREVLETFAARRIRCQVHYTPLHRLPAFGDVPARLRTPLDTLDAAFPGLVSLPLWRGMRERDQDRVIDTVRQLTLGAPRTSRTSRSERTAP
ncbi:DegT/DnrJ/EryC1/StrS family aminotransferase [Streptomyces sp. ODS28]|uniref:DegT/DnrJ/EryC1/StrS family aminotransferase n=1 Tax=Streptomyces sp. ODS28 TaxID=3136688 RepID=UPI0031EF16C8